MKSTFTDATFRTLVTAIAEALGDGWVVAKSGTPHGDPDADLTHPTLGDLGISTDRSDGSKLQISGRFKPYRHDVRSPSGHYIGVSATRTPAVIAAEVKRRLLPDYITALAEWKTDTARKDEYIALTARNAERIRATVDGRLLDHSSDSSELQVWGRGDIPTLRVFGDRVRFEHMSVSVNVAERILQVLVTAEEAKAAKKALDGERIV